MNIQTSPIVDILQVLLQDFTSTLQTILVSAVEVAVMNKVCGPGEKLWPDIRTGLRRQ